MIFFRDHVFISFLLMSIIAVVMAGRSGGVADYFDDKFVVPMGAQILTRKKNVCFAFGALEEKNDCFDFQL